MSAWEINTTSVQACSDNEDDYKRKNRQKTYSTSNYDSPHQPDSDYEHESTRIKRVSKKKKRHKKCHHGNNLVSAIEELNQLILLDDNVPLIDLATSMIRAYHHEQFMDSEHHLTIKPVCSLRRLCLEQIAGLNLSVSSNVPIFIKRQINQILLEKHFINCTTLWFNQALKQGESMAKLYELDKRKAVYNHRSHDSALWRCYRSLFSYEHCCSHNGHYNWYDNLLVRDSPEFESNCSINLVSDIRVIWQEHILKILSAYFVHLYRYEISFGVSRNCHSANKKRNRLSKGEEDNLQDGICSRVMEIVTKKVKHQFPHLTQMFECEALAYAHWAIGNLCVSTEKLLRVAQSENYASKCHTVPLMVDCALMWNEHDFIDLSSIIYQRLLKIVHLYSPYNRLLKQVQMIAAHQYDVGLMNREMADLSYCKWKEVMLTNHAQLNNEESVAAQFYGIVFLFVAHGDDTVNFLREAQLKLVFNSPFNLYFSAFVHALLGEKVLSKHEFQTFFYRIDPDNQLITSDKKLVELISSLVDTILPYNNTVRVPKILWRREFGPPCFYTFDKMVADQSRSDQIGHLCCRPLNMRLNHVGCLTIDIETQLPPRNNIVLYPLTGQLVSDCINIYPHNIPEMNYPTNRSTFSLNADFTNPRRVELYSTNSGDVIDLQIFGLMLSTNQSSGRQFMYPAKHNLYTVHWCGQNIVQLNLVHHMKKALKIPLKHSKKVSSHIITLLLSQDRCMSLHDVERILSLKPDHIDNEQSNEFSQWFKTFFPVYVFTLMRIVHMRGGCTLVFSYHPVVNSVVGDSLPVILIVMIDFSSQTAFHRPKIFIYNNIKRGNPIDLIFSKCYIEQQDNLPNLSDEQLFPVNHDPTNNNNNSQTGRIMSFLNMNHDISEINVNFPIGHWVIIDDNVLLTYKDYESTVFNRLLLAETMEKSVVASSNCGYIGLSRYKHLLAVFELNGSITFYNISNLLTDKLLRQLTIKYRCSISLPDCNTHQLKFNYSMSNFFLHVQPRIFDCRWFDNDHLLKAVVAFEQTLLILEADMQFNTILVRNIFHTPGLIYEAKLNKDHVACVVGFPYYPFCNFLHSLVIYRLNSSMMVNLLPGLGRGPHDLILEEIDDAVVAFLRDGHRGVLAARVSC